MDLDAASSKHVWVKAVHSDDAKFAISWPAIRSQKDGWTDAILSFAGSKKTIVRMVCFCKTFALGTAVSLLFGVQGGVTRTNWALSLLRPAASTKLLVRCKDRKSFVSD